MIYPPWVILHVPHDSTAVPAGVRDQFILDDDELALELSCMTDHHTLALFSPQSSNSQAVRAPVSRLVVDVERFPDDGNEPMAARGMGAVYTAKSGLKPMRRLLTATERDELMEAYYRPHHELLEAAVAGAVDRYGRCLVIDCHSFPGQALPYEMAEPKAIRPDICIGTDTFHTSSELSAAFVTAFQQTGWSVVVNEPFAGALVPGSRYGKDRRVSAVMVEVNRRLYLKGIGPERSPDFWAVAVKVQRSCMEAVSSCSETAPSIS